MDNFRSAAHDLNEVRDLLIHPFYQQRLGRWGNRPERACMLMDDNGCLIWQGCVNSRGYPANSRGLVHRQAWEAFHGPLPKHNQVHHVCGNKRCISVLHLQSLTPREHRRVEGRQKLDEHQVRQILLMIANGVSHSRIARKFGIRKAYVSQIKQGRVWAEVVREFWLLNGGSPARGPLAIAEAA